jgi:hypothetical protein
MIVGTPLKAFGFGVMIDDATLVRVTNVSALPQWASAFTRFGPFVLVTRNTMNTVDVVSRAKCKSCTGV